MASFENTVITRRSVEDVFAFVADFENVPKWNYAIVETKKGSFGAPPPPPGAPCRSPVGACKPPRHATDPAFQINYQHRRPMVNAPSHGWSPVAIGGSQTVVSPATSTRCRCGSRSTGAAP
jgi:hypothetical protein